MKNMLVTLLLAAIPTLFSQYVFAQDFVATFDSGIDMPAKTAKIRGTPEHQVTGGAKCTVSGAQKSRFEFIRVQNITEKSPVEKLTETHGANVYSFTVDGGKNLYAYMPQDNTYFASQPPIFSLGGEFNTMSFANVLVKKTLDKIESYKSFPARHVQLTVSYEMTIDMSGVRAELNAKHEQKSPGMFLGKRQINAVITQDLWFSTEYPRAIPCEQPVIMPYLKDVKTAVWKELASQKGLLLASTSHEKRGNLDSETKGFFELNSLKKQAVAATLFSSPKNAKAMTAHPAAGKNPPSPLPKKTH